MRRWFFVGFQKHSVPPQCQPKRSRPCQSGPLPRRSAHHAVGGGLDGIVGGMGLSGAGSGPLLCPSSFRSSEGPRRPSTHHWQRSGASRECADSDSGPFTMRYHGPCRNAKWAPRFCSGGDDSGACRHFAVCRGAPRWRARLGCTILVPVLESSNRSLRSRSTCSHRSESISPLRQPVRITSRMVATAAGEANPRVPRVGGPLRGGGTRRRKGSACAFARGSS